MRFSILHTVLIFLYLLLKKFLQFFLVCCPLFSFLSSCKHFLFPALLEFLCSKLALTFCVMISRSRPFPVPFVPISLDVISVLSIFGKNFVQIILIHWPQFHLFDFLIACPFDLFHYIFNFDFIIVKNYDLALEPTIFVVLDHSNFFD